MLPEGIPKLTLGWGVLEWRSENLVNPDGDHKGEQWVFKPDQARFILWFYAVDDNGKWIYRRAYRERAKGTGKSPMVAAMACAEMLGPVVFSHFDDDCKPVGRLHPNPLIQLTAVSETQCDQTMVLIGDMLADSPASKAWKLDIGLSRILVSGQRRRIEKKTSNFRSAEGGRPSFVILEETQNWIPAERGPQFASVLRRNLAKFGGRSVEVTNAPVPGENSVAEDTHKYWQQILSGKEGDPGILFDEFSLVVEDVYDKTLAMPALKQMYQDAPWVDINRIWAEINDPGTREIDARRFYFNEMVVNASMWLDHKKWSESKKSNLKLKKTDLISIGFKARKHCCAVVATRLEDCAVFLLDIWERPQGATREWEIPYREIDDRVRRYLEKYNVYNVVASPETFQDIIGRWAVDYEGNVEIEELWTSRNRQKTADAIELFETAVSDQRLVHDGNVDLTRHILNCYTDEVAQGILIRQETPYSTRYIVAAESAVLSMYAALGAIEDGALKEAPSGVLYSF